VYTEYAPYVLDRYKATDINEPGDLEFAELLYRGAKERRKTSGDA
jgi:CMP-N-acetylneuraminic acid synthetase